MNLETIGKQAKAAAANLAQTPAETIEAALQRIAELLWSGRAEILTANAQDGSAAKQSSLPPHLMDRLTLTQRKLEGIINDLLRVADLPSPVGEVFEKGELPNGLRVQKIRLPLGVVAAIYESRPNVTVDVAGLCLRSHNACILRGGSETLHTNRVLVNILRQALAESSLPADSVQWIDDPDRKYVLELLRLERFVDLIIPRGSNTLQSFCRENSRIPVIYGGIGICHLFVDKTADTERSLAVIRNAKIQAPSVCNALDVVLVHSEIAEEFIPRLVGNLRAAGVTLHLDEEAWRLVPDSERGACLPAEVDAFDTEWLSLNVSVKLAGGLEEAVRHIAEHSTHHSDGILTEDAANARRFLQVVDSAVVYHNASTRFTDGGQLGLGAEVAISTQRVHARGPLGLRELTTYKWVAEGEYSVRG